MLENILSIHIVGEESEALILLSSGIGDLEETVSGESRVTGPSEDYEE